MSRCSNRSYAASARLLLAVVIFPRVLPGLRRPGHAATASPTPSKPSRPRRSGLKRSGLDPHVNEFRRTKQREVTIAMRLQTTTCDVLGRKNFNTVVWLFGLVLAACDGQVRSLEESGLVSVTSIATSLHRDLVENSVAVTSVTQPGIIFGANDSGMTARIFAFDSTGTSRAIVEGRRVRETGTGRRPHSVPAVASDSGLIASTSATWATTTRSGTYVSIYRVPEPDGRLRVPIPCCRFPTVSTSAMPTIHTTWRRCTYSRRRLDRS